MTPTVEYVESKIGEFNALLFDSCLPPITVRLSRAKSYLGKVQYVRKRRWFGKPACNTDFVMRISTVFDLTEPEQEDVIIHEMIHCFIAVKGLKDSSTHGTLFRGMMERINSEFGRNVTVSHRMAPGTVNPRMQEVRLHHVCVSQLKDGHWGITVCSEAMKPKLDRLLPRYYPLSRKKWYTSRDTFFNRFPRARTPKVYKITEAELSEHLAELDELA